MSLTIDTVAACLAHSYEVWANCSCGRQERIDLAAVALAHGESLPLDRLWGKLRCTRCRSTRVSLQLTPGWNPYPGA